MKRPYADTPKADLKKLVADDEHNSFEDEETGDWIHTHWDCSVCDAESELEYRRYLKNSRKPGRLPHSDEGSISHNIKAEYLKLGSFCRYLSKPGTSDYPHEYAEAISVEIKPKKVIVFWRRTNTTEKPFRVSYKLTDHLNVVEKFGRRRNK